MVFKASRSTSRSDASLRSADEAERWAEKAEKAAEAFKPKEKTLRWRFGGNSGRPRRFRSSQGLSGSETGAGELRGVMERRAPAWHGP